MDTKAAIAAVLAAALVIGATPALAALATSTTPIQGETPLSTDQTPTVILADTSGTTNVDLVDYAQGSTLDIETAEGNITVTGDDGASARLATTDITGTQTQVTQISAGSNWLNLNPEDKNRMDVRGDADALAFEDITADDGTTDIQLTGTQGGTAEVRLYGLDADTEYGLYDRSRDQWLGGFTTDGTGDSGAVQVDMPAGSHSLEVRTATARPPGLSNPRPDGGVTAKPTQLQVDVDAEAYNVTVDFYLEGSPVGSDELGSDGTASTGVNIATLTDKNWSAVATDGLGQTDTINATIVTPKNLTLREEHAPQQRVNATATLRFFTAQGDVVVERQAQNGTLDMTGLPASEFVLSVDDVSDHYPRRVYLDSIFTQQNAFLLNSTVANRSQNEAIRSRFIYEDLTGRFPRPDTTIQLQRPLDLNGDNTSRYRTISGDFWGASNEYEDILEFGVRYRIKLVNRETGESLIQGHHVPTEELTNTIRVSGLVEEADNATGVVGLAQLNESAQTLDIAYRDPAAQTDTFAVRVENQSGGVLFADTVNTTLGTYTRSLALNSSEAEQSWVVVFDAGDRHRSAIPVGPGTIGLPVPVPGWLLTLLMTMSVTFIGALYGPRTALLGAWAMVFAAAGIAMFGWAFSTASVVIAALVAVGATFLTRALP